MRPECGTYVDNQYQYADKLDTSLSRYGITTSIYWTKAELHLIQRSRI